MEKVIQLSQQRSPSFTRGAVKLKGLAEEGWRIRVGDYRILYRIVDEEHVIEIYRIKHRGQVYR